MMRKLIAACLALACVAGPALAQFELGVYTGYQTAPHSTVKGNDPDGVGDFNFTTGWDGKSDELPPYWGIRGTWWQPNNFGYGVEFTHAKVYADENDRAAAGFDTLEFTDGLNLVTVNVMRRWPGQERRWMPYMGAGVGVAIPHVEAKTSGSNTFSYQLGGPAVQVVAGVSYPVTNSWSVFGEYKGTYSQNDTDLDGGGNLKTNIVTNALNVGVSFNF